jgi:opacity protein-like surface antigen
MRPSTAITLSSIAVIAALAWPAPAVAGSFGVEAQGGYHSLSASQSAKAVFGSTGGGTFGGALRYVYKGFYIAGGARTFSKSGERVYVAAAGGPVAKLGFPLDVRITPIFGTLGYRFREGRSLVPYLGVGGGVTQFSETSDVTGDVREESRSKSSFQACVGLEYGTGTIRFGAEGVYSSTPDSIGVGGVSKVYGENDIGGFSILGKLILSFGK